jgi:hypothetical protein
MHVSQNQLHGSDAEKLIVPVPVSGDKRLAISIGPI